MKEGDLHNQKYTLKRSIKTVLYNQTWLAEDHQNRTVILKFVKFPVKSKTQIDNQKIIFQKYKHQNMVNIHQTFTCECQASKYLVVAMQYCPDGDLAHLIQSLAKGTHKLNLMDKIQYMIQMASGIQYLHQNSQNIQNTIAHRNIKPENILRLNGVAKIGDLDLACIYRNKSTQQLSGGAGFPIYKAPEAYQSNSYYLQSDIWSLGLVFVELILQVRLKDVQRWKRQPCYKREQIQSLAQRCKIISSNLYDIIIGMLQIDPKQRMIAAQIVFKLNQLMEQLKPKQKTIIMQQKHNKIDKLDGPSKSVSPQKPLTNIPSGKRQEKKVIAKQQPKQMPNKKQIKPQYNKDMSESLKKGPIKQLEPPQNVIRSIEIYQWPQIVQFTLAFIKQEAHFEQINDLQLNSYLCNREKRKQKIKAKWKSEWVTLKTLNPKQRIKIRYASQNDSLTIHYEQLEIVLGIQHLPVQVRLNWQTVQDLYVELSNLKPEEVSVNDTQLVKVKKQNNKQQLTVKQPVLMKFKAMVSKNYRPRLHLFFPSQQNN